VNNLLFVGFFPNTFFKNYLLLNMQALITNSPLSAVEIVNLPFETFLDNLKAKIKNVFHARADLEKIVLKRGMPPFVMREIMSANPLSGWYSGRIWRPWLQNA
jgi:hypothetical protein